MDSKTVGVIYSQKITDVKKLNETPSERVYELHTPDGDIVQFLAVNILPEFQNFGLGDQLLEFALQRCSLINGLKSVVSVTLCRDYQKHKEMAINDYIHLKDSKGKMVDPILRFHQLHGAKIKELVPDYRVKDVDNSGYGVLVEYDIRNRERDDFTIESASSKSRAVSLKNHNIKDVENFLNNSIKEILGLTGTDTISPQQPLMEIGLDSASLLTLND